MLVDELRALEERGVFTNFGSVNTAFEQRLVDDLFAGTGYSVSVTNATIGLMVAMREAAVEGSRRRYALMPSFTFAATGHAAVWAGLTPLLCDIDPATWLPSATAESALIDEFGDAIACVVPYATFGNCLDLPRYAELADRIGAGLVVDAAASLGSLDANGDAFGHGSAAPVVFSLHATKTFATHEGGVIYTTDAARAGRLRAMTNFGFEQPRTATLPGLNGKLTEVMALLATARLDEHERAVARRTAIARRYQEALPDLTFQQTAGRRTAHQFVPALLPEELAHRRGAFIAAMEGLGVGLRTYFSPHLAEQPYFARLSVVSELSVTDALASRIICLPMSDGMTDVEADWVADAVRLALEQSGA